MVKAKIIIRVENLGTRVPLHTQLLDIVVFDDVIGSLSR